ncbi:hypothetical protein [Cohnella endophytica]|uniref:hypothetical protein n=1 Tax=Cohnella endophytica TaxID=2419778 RepID=UPI0011C412C0|nr:hypothetical protein [Cohnella endophytica]
MLKKELAGARGQRREMLERDLSATKKMLEVIYPVLGKLEGIVLEYEMVALSGVKIYGDAFHRALNTVFEEENFITHAETITRKRFSFERARARSVGVFGHTYFPYSRDELEQQPDICRRDLHELMVVHANVEGMGILELPVYEREVLRFALLRDKPFGLGELSGCLKLTPTACGKITKTLVVKGLLSKVGGGERRCFEFRITEAGVSMFNRRHSGRSLGRFN